MHKLMPGGDYTLAIFIYKRKKTETFRGITQLPNMIPNTASNVYTAPMVATPQMQYYLQLLSNVGSPMYPINTPTTPASTNCHTPASLSFTQHPLGTPNNLRFDCNSISSRRSTKLGRTFKRLFKDHSPQTPTSSTLPPLPIDPVRPPLTMICMESVYDKPKLTEDPVEGLFLAEIQEFRHVDSEG
ncbi:hypothetical protein Ciccas_009755 [Cichlidogyrus casuarinus]|uniref:Uncharacterized protein n=1 Tax=Cichlidogyrus casuarinus TaxID=1844966 RepID=A0ABD2PW38_9PLAT